MNRQDAHLKDGVARRWSPPPLLYASAAVHLGAAAAALARPRVWPWALCALAANHMALAAAGLSGSVGSGGAVVTAAVR